MQAMALLKWALLVGVLITIFSVGLHSCESMCNEPGPRGPVMQGCEMFESDETRSRTRSEAGQLEQDIEKQ